MAVRQVVRTAINAVLKRVNLQLRHWDDDGVTPAHIPAKATIEGARRAGLSVGDFIDGNSAEPGATGEVIDRMRESGALGPEVAAVCEIGPGSGRYTEPVLAQCRPRRYEVYEPARDWAEYLESTYPIALQPCDGRSLAATSIDSIDLAHAHKVFVALPAIVTIGYLKEMCRVVRPGGHLVFDVVTERCLDAKTVEQWSGHDVLYPTFMPRVWVLDFLGRHGVVLVDSFLCPMSGGFTEVLILRRTSG